VFSGPKSEKKKKGSAKASLPRRLAIGAVWMGGISYSLSVVGEYFRTGGSDAKGPKGL
jgi:hypothetical protein